MGEYEAYNADFLEGIDGYSIMDQMVDQRTFFLASGCRIFHGNVG